LHDFVPVLDASLAAADVACLLIDAPSDAHDDAIAEVARPLNEMAQSRGIATLLPGRASLAQHLRVDGVHLDLSALDENTAMRIYRDARKALGPDAIVGALCAAGRHMALELAELDADYVGFAVDAAETPDLIAWWAEVMNAPCVAFGAADLEQAQASAASGADFIALSPALWNSPNAATYLREVQRAIGPG
jgi:thiamine-phosphate pyrophosphorylase